MPGRYLLRRLLLILPTLLGITLVTFFLFALVPGGPEEARWAAGGGAPIDPAVLESFRLEHRLDSPLPLRYLTWLGRLLRLDLGRSFRDHRPVRDVILERLPPTLLLNGAALALLFAVALPVGWLSAVWKGGWFDRGSALFLYMVYCLPGFALAVLLQIQLASRWQLLPLEGFESPIAGELGFLPRLGDRLRHLALPSTCLALGSLAYLARFARAGLLESIRQEYVVAARAKGLPRRAVLRHALRNSLIPLLTLGGILVPALIGGSVIIERIFSWPGIGRLFFTAVDARDLPVIMGLTTLSAVLSLGGLLASDLLYVWADPRVSLDGRGRG